MKKFLVLLFSLFFILGLSACSQPTEQQSNASPTENNVPAGEPTSALPYYHWKLASILTSTDTDTIELVETALQNIYNRTDGHVEIEHHPDSTLGDYTNAFGEVMRGTIEMYLMTPPTTYDASIELLTLPYMVTNYEEAHVAYSPGSALYDMMDDVFTGLNIKLLGFWADGFHSLGFKKDPGDYMDFATNNDLLIRVPPAEVYQLQGQAFGYRTSAIAWNDIYTSLQTGIVDGYLGSVTRYCYLNFGDQTNYLIRTNEVFECMPIAINLDLWNSLPEEYQTIIQEEITALIGEGYDLMETLETGYIEKLETEYGTVILQPTQEELDTLAEMMRETVWPTLLTNYDATTMNAIFEDLGIDYRVE